MINRVVARGTTEVTRYEPSTYDEQPDGPKLVEVQLVETFRGALEAQGTARVLQAHRDDGSLSYCTIERVVGALAGRNGSFLGVEAELGKQGAWTLDHWFD